jgi:putative ABC transport system permease protein
MSEALSHDLRHAVRLLRKSPGFTAAAVLTLALGIGVNTTMFTVVYGVLLRALPYPEPERLVRLVQAHSRSDVTVREFEVVKTESRAFSSVAAYRGGGERRIGPPHSQDWVAALVASTDLLRTLGVAPQLGREFTSEETRAGGPQAVLISDGVWRRVFGADRQILGRAVTLNDASFTVAGVLPADFWFPQPVDVVVPLQSTGSLTDTGTNTQMIARVGGAFSMAQAQAEVAAVTERIREAAGASLARSYRGLMVLSYRDWLVGDVRLNLLLLFGASGLLLLIACGNLAMLLLARFASRAREIAVRMALGSARRRLLAQFLTENLVIAALGAAAGVLTAFALVSGFVAWIPFNLPASAPIAVDRAVLAFTVATALATAVLFTLVPFLSSGRMNVPDALRSEGRHPGSGTVHARLRNTLIVGEVALSTTLLVAAGLLIQTLHQTTRQELGFVPDRVLTFETPFAPERARNAADRLLFTRTLLERLNQTPGVTGAAATNMLPLTRWSNLPTQRDGHPDQSIGGMEVRAVSPDYFAVMGIPLRRGRSISASDDATGAPVVVINDTVARSWWPEGNALGDRLTIGRYQGKKLLEDVSREVIGVARDTRTASLQAAERPTVFVPVTSPFGASSLAWVVKIDAQASLAENIRAAVASVDPAQRITRLRMMDEIVASASATPRFNASLFAIFAGVALLLAVVGLYGVLSFLVAQRRHEIGTRLALGASRGAVLRGFVRQGLSLTAVGLTLGLGTAMVVSRWLSALLFGVQPNDPINLAGVATLMLLVGLAASYLPARRAASTDPMVALRSE